MNSELPSEVTSFLTYFTNLWASVPTIVIFSELNWKKTPLITGLKSSFPVAKIVELIALDRTPPFIEVDEESFISIGFGNSSAGTNDILYFPSFALISSTLSSWVENVRGCSTKFFKASTNNLAGTAISPELSDSISITVDIVVSKSEDVTLKEFLFIWNKKLSNIGKVFVVLTTPRSICKFFKRVLLETINFINILLSQI